MGLSMDHAVLGSWGGCVGAAVGTASMQQLGVSGLCPVCSCSQRLWGFECTSRSSAATEGLARMCSNVHCDRWVWV
jgi:hypothetical protein